MFQQFTLFITRVGWPGITFGKTDAYVLIYKKQADRKRKIGERIIEYVQHTATVSNLINFKSQKTKKPLEKFVRNLKSGGAFYNNDLT